MVAISGAAYAVANIPTPGFTKLFLTMAFIFGGVMCFVLAKYIRDRQAKMKQTPSFNHELERYCLRLRKWAMWIETLSPRLCEIILKLVVKPPKNEKAPLGALFIG